jgi:predicted CopG family antitoxin
MLEQLTISLTDTEYCKVERLNTSKKAISEWIKRRTEGLEKDVEYHEKYWALDQENNKESNAWIKAIVDSLPKEVEA